jgi:hypothetical protein
MLEMLERRSVCVWSKGIDGRGELGGGRIHSGNLPSKLE